MLQPFKENVYNLQVHLLRLIAESKLTSIYFIVDKYLVRSITSHDKLISIQKRVLNYIFGLSLDLCLKHKIANFQHRYFCVKSCL